MLAAGCLGWPWPLPVAQVRKASATLVGQSHVLPLGPCLRLSRPVPQEGAGPAVDLGLVPALRLLCSWVCCP